MSEEAFDFVCTSCAKNDKLVKAVKYCIECSGYCCQACTDVHRVFPALENHNLMEVSQRNQASGQLSSLLEFPTERCSKHKGKVLDMYCEGHDVVGCSTCFVKSHKSCQDSHTHSIPDMIDNIYKSSLCQETHSRLKDMTNCLESLCKYKDTQLQRLNTAKKEALAEVKTFQQVLEALFMKAVEYSRQQVEAAYKKMEFDILHEKHNAKDICEELQKTEEKLNQSEGNRAQRFVCTKIAEEVMRNAETGKMKHEQKRNSDEQISFIPDQSLVKYLNALQGIGQVQNNEKRKDNLYEIKDSRDINIKLSDDSKTCSSFGCYLTHDNQLLVTDESNKKLKRFDIQSMTVLDYCTLDSAPYGVCSVSNQEVAVACHGDNKIQFVSIHNKMAPTKHIQMSHRCYGIAFNDSKFFVTDFKDSLFVYDMTGTLLKKISRDNAGNKLFNASRLVTLNESENKILVGGSKNLVVCFDYMGNYLSTISDTDLSHADGVCVDDRGNMLVVGYESKNVVQFSENGKKVGVVVKNKDGLLKPVSVCFNQRLNRMFVTMLNSDVAKMYDLE